MMSDQSQTTVFDPKCPWPSIAHALEYYDGVPRVVVVPEAPAASFCVDGVTVLVRESADVPGVACSGRQAVDDDAKEVWLAKARRGVAG